MDRYLLLIFFTTTVAGRYTGPINEAGLSLIKKFEGWYPDFYIDPVGIKTIGYGHACHVWNCSVPLNGKYPVPLSLDDGNSLLIDDLTYPHRYEGCLNDNVQYEDFNADQFSALSSFTFNLGCGNLRKSTLLRLLNAGDICGASKEFPKWVHGGGRILPGLVKRREEERKLFCSYGTCNCNQNQMYDNEEDFCGGFGVLGGTSSSAANFLIDSYRYWFMTVGVTVAIFT